MKKPPFNSAEIQTLKHALYIHRHMVREQQRLALAQKGEKAKRDSFRFDRIINHSLELDSKLDDMAIEAAGKIVCG